MNMLILFMPQGYFFQWLNIRQNADRNLAWKYS